MDFLELYRYLLVLFGIGLVIFVHEAGHFIEHNVSRSDNPGGFHDGSPADPRLAWSEGYATWLATAVLDRDTYIDTYPGGASVWEVGASGIRASAWKPMSQDISEYTVADLLFWMSQGAPNQRDGVNATVDVLSDYLPTRLLVDRGFQGLDLVEYLDGWFCRGHDDLARVSPLITDSAGFPYDFGGPTSCQ